MDSLQILLHGDRSFQGLSSDCIVGGLPQCVSAVVTRISRCTQNCCLLSGSLGQERVWTVSLWALLEFRSQKVTHPALGDTAFLEKLCSIAIQSLRDFVAMWRANGLGGLATPPPPFFPRLFCCAFQQPYSWLFTRRALLLFLPYSVDATQIRDHLFLGMRALNLLVLFLQSDPQPHHVMILSSSHVSVHCPYLEMTFVSFLVGMPLDGLLF